jgi:hypothetical protein
MAANPFPGHVYYRCPHNPASPRHQAAAPGHPRTVQAPETLLDQITGQFFRDRVFTPARAALVAAQLPASDADAAARRDQAAAALNAQVKELDAQQNAQITALEDVPDGPAGKAMRARINERFAQLHDERTTAEAKLAALTTERPRAADPAILDEIPYAGDIIPSLPPALKARLFAAFDLAILWNKDKAQATISVTITDTTLTALSEILDPSQPGYHDTASPADHESIGHLTQPAIGGPLPQPPPGRWQGRDGGSLARSEANDPPSGESARGVITATSAKRGDPWSPP